MIANKTTGCVFCKKDSLNRVLGYVVPQLILTVVVSSLLLLVSNSAAYSALAGGLIATLTSGWFALKVFAGRETKQAADELRSFYWAEINKIVMTGAMFIAVFVLIRPVNGAALLAVYFLVYIAPAVVDVIRQPKRRREN
ncbi:MAG: ATP synthase subunit I [Gammaproteobacteria bacterium]|nr:ATP synthase subunit I [Gammaproteobacteria bacterium]